MAPGDPRAFRMRPAVAAMIAACVAALGCGWLLLSAAPAGAWAKVDPTIVKATVVEEAVKPLGIHDQCASGFFTAFCEGTLTVIDVQVHIPPRGGEDCEGSTRVGYESTPLDSEGHLSGGWPGGDQGQNCWAMEGCSETAECTLEWTIYPFAYGGTKDCTHNRFELEVSLEYLGNGEGYSPPYPVEIKPWTDGCTNTVSGPSGGGSHGDVTLKEGQATIVHADGSKQTCEPGNCSDITFGVGDRVTTGPGTYLEIESKAGRFFLGPKTTLTLTAKFIELSGGVAQFKLTGAPCTIYVAPPAKLGAPIVRVVPRKCKGADISVEGTAKGAKIRDDNNGQLGVSNGQGRDTVELRRSGQETNVGVKGKPAPPSKPKLKLCRTANSNESEFGFCLPFHK